MKRVILESPFAGNVPRNIAYAKACLLDCLKRHEAPIASHLLWTQPGLLDDNDKEQRQLGMAAGWVWTYVADLVVIYDDFGISNGMKQGVERAEVAGVPWEYRQLPKETVEALKVKYP